MLSTILATPPPPSSDYNMLNVLETCIYIASPPKLSSPPPPLWSIFQAAFNSLPGCTAAAKDAVSLLETRHYYVNVEKCLLELVIREVGDTYRCGGDSTPIKSWSMRYTKSRRRPQARSLPHPVIEFKWYKPICPQLFDGRSTNTTTGRRHPSFICCLVLRQAVYMVVRENVSGYVSRVSRISRFSPAGCSFFAKTEEGRG